MQFTFQGTSAATLSFGSFTGGPITFTGSIAPIFQNITLASGANTITPPTSAIGVIIAPPVTNTVALTLKGVTGDTGLSLPPASPSLFIFGTLPATFVITAGSLTTGYTQLTFF